MARNLKIRDLTLRDGQQSSFATRMSQAQVDRCLPFYKDANFYAMEVWGGAVPDSVMRYLNENPWTRLETIYKAVGKVSKLTALSRGRNLFGYAPYPDDVIDGFCRNAIESGLGIMRIFDALNDVDNVKSTIKYVKQYGGIADCAVCYTVDPKYPEPSFMQRLMGRKQPQPVFTDAYFLDKAKQMAALGADMITIKDMSGLLKPYAAKKLISALKQEVGLPIHLHTHNTTGTGDMVNLMAAMAGVDIVDTALSPLANGTSQPATESLVATLLGTVRDTGLDQSKLSEAAAHFRKVAARLQNEGILDPKVLNVDTNTLLYQVPGGMLSNLISQLKQAGKEDKYYDVLAEIPRVRKDFGYPPLVTPTSQIVGTQAVMNVIVGKYKTFPKESKGLLRGEYGALPGEVNPEVRALAGIDPEEVITCRPADNIAPELETYKEQFKDIAKSEEDVLSLALFPQVAPKFLTWRDGPHEAPAQPAEAPKAPPADPNAVRELFVEYKF